MLRRELGFLAGVAANLVGLACIAAGQGRSRDSRDLLNEAYTLAPLAGAGDRQPDRRGTPRSTSGAQATGSQIAAARHLAL